MFLIHRGRGIILNLVLNMSDVHPSISEHIWFEILTKLPVKTLVKCRCVSKSWDSLIVSPSFMGAHLKSYTQDEPNSLLLYRHIIFTEPPKCYEEFILLRDSTNVNGGNSILAGAYRTLVCPFKVAARYSYMSCSFLVASIHGLLCLSDAAYLDPGTTQIMIWNPLVRKHINLPQSMTANNGLGDHTSVLGFGYHGKNNDHRVVKISFSSKNHGSSTFIIPFAEVYSVQERAWRMLSSDFKVHVPINAEVSHSHCFLNGVIHWLNSRVMHHGFDKWLLMFNVEEEKFEKMELPDALVNTIDDNYCGSCIFEYQNKLSVSVCSHLYEDIVKRRCQIWVKEDYNVRSSWCKVLDVALDRICGSAKVKYLGSSGKLFGLYRGDNMEQVLYDPKTGYTEVLGLLCNSTTMFSAYTESLFLLDQKT